MARRSFRSISSMLLSSATRKAMLSTPSCTSVRPSRRPRRTGPMSLTVMRTGMPPSPSMSQRRTGQPEKSMAAGSRLKVSAQRLEMKSVSSPASAMPVTSPLTSAMNTGTPAREKPSAITLSVTVLPVPEAPAIRPWRFAWLSSRLQATSPWAIQILSLSSMLTPFRSARGARRGRAGSPRASRAGSRRGLPRMPRTCLPRRAWRRAWRARS